jgi:pimeloyl-ACP methyl ester carboxylesterase
MKSWRNSGKRHARGVLMATLCLIAIDARAMERIKVEPDVEVEYTVRGSGAAVVLVHAGLFAGWFKPLLEEKALTGRYRVVSFHRVGYAGSSRVAGAVSIARQAQHVVALMRHLGIERAHVVGHSSGANIALQLALDSPERVHSLALLEPALPVSEGSERLLSTRQAVMAPILESYRAGDKSAAVDGFMKMVSGPAYRSVLERALPGEFARGVADADTFFQQELPAIMQWRLAREDAARIKQPALAVMGERSRDVSPIWEARHQQLLTWLPNAEGFVLPGATHLLHVQDPQGMALELTRFFARHPF